MESSSSFSCLCVQCWIKQKAMPKLPSSVGSSRTGVVEQGST